MKTVKVRSAVNVGGLSAGQEAEVEDTDQTRSLIKSGYWALLVPVGPKKAPKVDSTYAEQSGDDVPGLPFGDPADPL
jgi:hypothetical protein